MKYAIKSVCKFQKFNNNIDSFLIMLFIFEKRSDTNLLKKNLYKENPEYVFTTLYQILNFKI